MLLQEQSEVSYYATPAIDNQLRNILHKTHWAVLTFRFMYFIN